jgi:2,3-dihydroxybiphenyl 1,2-dioxygenase
MAAVDENAPAVRALGYIGIAARDLPGWDAFATNILGLQVREREGDGTLHLRMDEHFHRIIVGPGNSDDLDYAGWEVHGEPELERIAARLEQQGVRFARGSAQERERRRVGGLLLLEDPAGLRTEIFWGPLIDDATPFQSPRAISGFDTRDKGLGHIVLAVDDFDRAMLFYRDLLGMRISDYITWDRMGTTVTAAFLHCNPRHHSLAFMALPSAPKRLTHVMLEVESLDDVGRTYSLCERENVPIAMTLGRHTNDLMFSFYAVTPSGFSVEYGWGGRTIDDDVWEVQTHDIASMWGHRRLAPIAR